MASSGAPSSVVTGAWTSRYQSPSTHSSIEVLAYTGEEAGEEETRDGNSTMEALTAEGVVKYDIRVCGYILSCKELRFFLSGRMQKRDQVLINH